MRASSNQSSRVLLLARGFNDLGEAARVQAGAADESAIDIGLAYQFACVLWFYASAILKTHALGRRVVSHFAQDMANKSVRFLRLIWGRIASSPDGPDRLVRDHCFLQFLRIQTSETATQLDRQDFFNISFVALLECFS